MRKSPVIETAQSHSVQISLSHPIFVLTTRGANFGDVTLMTIVPHFRSRTGGIEPGDVARLNGAAEMFGEPSPRCPGGDMNSRQVALLVAGGCPTWCTIVQPRFNLGPDNV
jgi:hypothetical protein